MVGSCIKKLVEKVGLVGKNAKFTKYLLKIALNTVSQ
ncbi:hypothetical protein B6N60_04306 [Richelia sinica FACHB-800]|uniref:Uncharacterized protein n=1 Tax=Richelia sinica FACHB-800 TaxID=1357546 RepID=A0A975TCW5_9NOST|nr:hypothetical protein B6N60_04306 [Richelia sinica FACHB-800]